MRNNVLRNSFFLSLVHSRRLKTESRTVFIDKFLGKCLENSGYLPISLVTSPSFLNKMCVPSNMHLRLIQYIARLCLFISN